jgi:hypothetical protein
VQSHQNSHLGIVWQWALRKHEQDAKVQDYVPGKTAMGTRIMSSRPHQAPTRSRAPTRSGPNTRTAAWSLSMCTWAPLRTATGRYGGQACRRHGYRQTPELYPSEHWLVPIFEPCRVDRYKLVTGATAGRDPQNWWAGNLKGCMLGTGGGWMRPSPNCTANCPVSHITYSCLGSVAEICIGYPKKSHLY